MPLEIERSFFLDIRFSFFCSFFCFSPYILSFSSNENWVQNRDRFSLSHWKCSLHFLDVGACDCIQGHRYRAEISDFLLSTLNRIIDQIERQIWFSNVDSPLIRRSSLLVQLTWLCIADKRCQTLKDLWRSEVSLACIKAMFPIKEFE